MVSADGKPHEMANAASGPTTDAPSLANEQAHQRLTKLNALRGELRQGLESGASEPWNAAATKEKARAGRTKRD